MMKRLLSAMLLISLCMLSGVTPAAQDNPDARVKAMATTLNLRQTPTVSGAVIAELAGGTPLKLAGRSMNGLWLKVETDEGLTGWVSTAYVQVYVALSAVPVTEEAAADAPAASAPTAESAPAAVSGDPSEGHVTTVLLRLRQSPSLVGAILRDMPQGTPLHIEGRSEDGTWYSVATQDGQAGWAYAAYIAVGVSALSVSAGNSANLPPASTVVGIRAIYQRGQALGNQRSVFAKIGDSITTSEYSLDALGRGQYTLGGYGGLQWIIDMFAPGFNSFTHVSAAAGAGWTSQMVLEARFRNTAVCNAEISPLECELNTIRPSIALIEFGTNDVQYISTEQFAYNMNRIVDICIEKGVIPVLATLPVRAGFEGSIDAFNTVIRSIAANRGLPLWDVRAALDGLPGRGMSGDGIHPSTPPGGYADSANFGSGEAMQAGYVARNLTALQILASTVAAMGG